MKTLFKSISVVALIALTIVSCKKNETNPVATNSKSTTLVENSSNSSARMWATGKQLYAVGHNSSGSAFLYTLTPPGTGGLVPTVVSGFFVSSQPVTNVTGIAYATGSIVISTAASSDFPSKLLIYPAGGPYNAPVSVSCAGITDIEYNEYDSNLYGILTNSIIVQINMTTGAQTTILAPTIPTGFLMRGLCNYNGLLSYSINDNTTAADNFYSCSPSGSMVSLLFSTDWGTGNGGMQYCDGFGWEIISFTSTTKQITNTTYVVTGPTAMSGGPYLITDMTSN